MLGRLAIGLATPGYESICPRPLPLSDNQLDPPAAGETDEIPWHGDNTSYIPGLNRLSGYFWSLARDSIGAHEPRLKGIY